MYNRNNHLRSCLWCTTLIFLEFQGFFSLMKISCKISCVPDAAHRKVKSAMFSVLFMDSSQSGLAPSELLKVPSSTRS
jgi:hypothetical protein